MKRTTESLHQNNRIATSSKQQNLFIKTEERTLYIETVEHANLSSRSCRTKQYIIDKALAEFRKKH